MTKSGQVEGGEVEGVFRVGRRGGYQEMRGEGERG